MGVGISEIMNISNLEFVVSGTWIGGFKSRVSIFAEIGNKVFQLAILSLF